MNIVVNFVLQLLKLRVECYCKYLLDLIETG
jgi:hypothetical protein